MFNAWIQFGFQPVMPKKKEEEKMMTSIFPWFNEKQIAQLERDTANIADPMEKIKMQDSIYRQVAPMIKEKEAKEARMKAKNQFFYANFDEKDLQRSKLNQVQLKIEDLADMVKERVGIPATAKTEEVMNLFSQELQQRGIEPQILQDYVDWKSEELLYLTELKARPVEPVEEEKSVFENIVWWAAESTSWIAEFAWTNLAKGIWWISKKLWADETKVNQLVDSYIKSWDTLWWEDIGDEDSLVYQWAKMLFDIAQVATPWWLARWAAKWTQVAWKWAKAVEWLWKINKNWAKLADDIAIWWENVLLKAWMKPEAAEKAAQLTSKVLSRAWEWALDMVMFDIIAEWELPNLKEVWLWAAIGWWFPLAWVIAKWLWKAGRVWLEQILWATTGKWKTAIAETFAKAGRNADFTKWMRWNINIDEVLSNVEQWLNNFKSSNRAIYWEQYSKLLENTKNIALKEWEDSILNWFTKKLKDSRIKFTDEWLDFTQSTVQNSTDQTKIKQVYELLQNWEDVTPAWMDALKQAIRNTYNFKVDSSVVQKIIGETANDVKSKIVKEVPEYADMMVKYEKFKTILDDISWALSIWSTKAKKQTALTKLQRALKDNQELKKEMLDTINKYSKDDIVWQLAWVQMSEILPWWLMKVFGWAGIWAASIWLLNPKFLAWLITMSPRAIAEIARWLNISTDILNKAITNANKFIPTEAKVVWTEALLNKKE